MANKDNVVIQVRFKKRVYSGERKYRTYYYWNTEVREELRLSPGFWSNQLSECGIIPLDGETRKRTGLWGERVKKVINISMLNWKYL